MNTILTVVGVLLFIVVMGDFVASTLGTHGQGRASAWIGERVYSLFCAASERLARGRLRRLIGPAALLVVAGFWVFGSWIAWTLIFFGTDSLRVTAATEPGELGEQLGEQLGAVFTFVGSSLSTAGTSKLETTGFLGDLLTVLAAVQGMAVLTLTTSLLLNLTQTVVSGRSFSLETSSADSLEELERETALAEFRNLCARLHVYPQALYFAPPHDEASLADALVRFQQMVSEQPDALRREREVVRKGLALLPFINPGHERTPSDEQIRAWKQRYGFG